MNEHSNNNNEICEMNWIYCIEECMESDRFETVTATQLFDTMKKVT